MKVYVLTETAYNEFEILGVFTYRSTAQSLLDGLSPSTKVDRVIEEYELDEVKK